MNIDQFEGEFEGDEFEGEFEGDEFEGDYFELGLDKEVLVRIEKEAEVENEELNQRFIDSINDNSDFGMWFPDHRNCHCGGFANTNVDCASDILRLEASRNQNSLVIASLSSSESSIPSSSKSSWGVCRAGLNCERNKTGKCSFQHPI